MYTIQNAAIGFFASVLFHPTINISRSLYNVISFMLITCNDKFRAVVFT